MNNEVKTKTNLEHYKGELKEILLDDYDNPREVFRKISERFDRQIKISLAEHPTDAILNWMAQPYKEPVLDDVEKEYLGAVIKPFRNRIKYIYLATYVEDYYQIRIVLKSNIFINTNYVSIANLPPFEKGTMYKGMVIDRHYSLKELGL